MLVLLSFAQKQRPQTNGPLLVFCYVPRDLRNTKGAMTILGPKEPERVTSRVQPESRPRIHRIRSK